MELESVKNRDDIALLLSPGAIAAELGVWLGEFSEKLLQSPNVGHLYSIDAWGDEAHPVREYIATIARLEPYRNRNTILRMRFDQAVKMFPDEHFDLVYVDGYAHEGEDKGNTFWEWWPKVKRGGIFAGHDYDKKHWELVPLYLDKFVAHHGLKLHITSEQSEPRKVIFPSWIVRKP